MWQLSKHVLMAERSSEVFTIMYTGWGFIQRGEGHLDSPLPRNLKIITTLTLVGAQENILYKTLHASAVVHTHGWVTKA